MCFGNQLCNQLAFHNIFFGVRHLKKYSSVVTQCDLNCLCNEKRTKIKAQQTQYYYYYDTIAAVLQTSVDVYVDAMYNNIYQQQLIYYRLFIYIKKNKQKKYYTVYFQTLNKNFFLHQTSVGIIEYNKLQKQFFHARARKSNGPALPKSVICLVGMFTILNNNIMHDYNNYLLK